MESIESKVNDVIVWHSLNSCGRDQCRRTQDTSCTKEAEPEESSVLMGRLIDVEDFVESLTDNLDTVNQELENVDQEFDKVNEELNEIDEELDGIHQVNKGTRKCVKKVYKYVQKGFKKSQDYG